MGERSPVVLELVGISKHFGGVQAVDAVDLSIGAGVVHAIVGENGAGKSTLAKMICGELAPAGGRMLVDGEEAAFGSPRAALAQGITTIDQELALVPRRSVLENVFLATESHRAGVVDRRELGARFAALMQDTGFDLDPDAIVATLRIAEQQKVEIARALARDARFIIMDEPTARLTQVESDQLYRIIDTLRRRGTTVLYISHFLREVLDLADVVTIMRDGRLVRSGPAAEETPESLIAGMLGRTLDVSFPERNEAVRPPAPVLSVRGLAGPSGFHDVSLAIQAGEIVGLAGLIGSGRSEVARAIVGADPVSGGDVEIDGRVVRISSPRDATAAGISLLPESRKDEGLVMTRSISENIVLARLGMISHAGVVRRRREREIVKEMMTRLSIRATGASAPVSSLSGGNQQKVLFAKCLMGNPKVLIADEPTRGVDVGAKRAIYELLTELAASGLAILLISSELEEILGLAHRVLVMRRGSIAAEFSAADANEEGILAAAFG